MLAYVFWHRHAEQAPQVRYEQALVAFHRSLQRRRPAGMLGSVAFRVAGLPWPERREPALGGMRATPSFPLAPRLHTPVGYEDWYFVEDFASVGVLNEAAVGRGHKTSHNEVARLNGAGTAAIFQLQEGNTTAMRERGVSVWVAVGVSVGVAVGVSVGVSVGVDVGLSVGVEVGVSVGVEVGVSVGVGVAVSVGVAVGVLVGVSVGVCVDVDVGLSVGV